MEDQSVVEGSLFFLSGLFVRELFGAFGKPDKIRDRLGRFVFEQAHYNVSQRSFKNSVSSCRPAHASPLCTGSSYTSRSAARPTTAVANLSSACKQRHSPAQNRRT